MKKIENTSYSHFHDEELRSAWLKNLGKVGKHFADNSGTHLYIDDGKLIAVPISTKSNRKMIFTLGGAILGNYGVIAASAISEKIFKPDEIDTVEILYWDLKSSAVECWEEKDGEFNTYFSVKGKCRLGHFEKICEITFRQAGCANNRSFLNSKNKYYEETCTLLGINASRNLVEMKQDMRGNRKAVTSLLGKFF
jgi:hypothetical protein